MKHRCEDIKIKSHLYDINLTSHTVEFMKNTIFVDSFIINRMVVNDFFYICTPIFGGVMRTSKEYVVPFEGLKLGKHHFIFEITDAFFEDIEYSLIDKGDVTVEMILDKKETMMNAAIHFEGFIWSACDLCTEPLKVDLKEDHKIIFKFGDSESEDENLIMVNSNEFELYLAPLFYELITVSLPNKNVHEDGECNENMLDLLDKYSGSEEAEDEGSDEIDPRWKALKNLN
jgi:uncharacterized metal-binding protein YceD (DUF177 family)